MYPLKGTSREKNRPLCTVCARPPLGLGTWNLPPPGCRVAAGRTLHREGWVPSIRAGRFQAFCVSTGSWPWACRCLVRMCRARSPASAGTACGRGGLQPPSEYLTPRKVLTVISSSVWILANIPEAGFGDFLDILS